MDDDEVRREREQWRREAEEAEEEFMALGEVDVVALGVCLLFDHHLEGRLVLPARGGTALAGRCMRCGSGALERQT